jgi:hypothetical protein
LTSDQDKGDTAVKQNAIPVVIAVLSLTSTLIVVMIVWMTPAVGVKNSACEQYPLTSGCR